MGHYRIPLLRNETICIPHGKVQAEKPVQLFENKLRSASWIHVSVSQLGNGCCEIGPVRFRLTLVQPLLARIEAWW
jgi:hypothetical protein